MTASIHRIPVSLVVAALGAIAVSASPVAAADPSKVSRSVAPDNPHEVIYSQVVETGDLNLATQQGAATLYLRISRAARAVCGGSPDAFWPFEHRHYQCRNEAMRKAIAEIDAPTLTAYYQSKNGAREPAKRVASAEQPR